MSGGTVTPRPEDGALLLWTDVDVWDHTGGCAALANSEGATKLRKIEGQST
jgi:hypothetical protein